MQEFIKIPATKRSTSKRKLVHGVGVNDAKYITQPSANNCALRCPAYTKWTDMLKRCYSEKALSRDSRYRECYVSDDWLLFSRFESWFRDNYIDGFDLDKDLKVKGNKVYSSGTCLFIPRDVNSFLTNKKTTKSSTPTGVSFDKRRGKHYSSIRVAGKSIHLGYFPNVDEASVAYSKRRDAELVKKCSEHPSLAKYLVNHLSRGINA